MLDMNDVMNNPNYQFNHLDISILKLSSFGLVETFSVTYQKPNDYKGLTPTMVELSMICDSKSVKRPPGYLICAGFDIDEFQSQIVFVSEELYRRLSSDELHEVINTYEVRAKTIQNSLETAMR